MPRSPTPGTDRDTAARVAWKVERLRALWLTLGTKYRESNTELKLSKTEPKLSKPKYSVPCSVPSF